MSSISEPPTIDLASELVTLLAQIPVGAVTSFGDLATALGDIAAAQWVARWLAGLPDDSLLPWHRVLRRPGRLATGSAERQRLQAQRLTAEGITIDAEDRIPSSVSLWTTFETTQPLVTLAAWQDQLGRSNVEPWLNDLPVIVGGVDLSYPSDNRAVAALANVNHHTGMLMNVQSLRSEITFPYIPGYLTFREWPMLRELLAVARDAGQLPPVLLVDGNGRLHPRRAGIAVAVAALTGIPTIGVSKHLLCGRIDPERIIGDTPAIVDADEVLGVVLDQGSKRRTAYVSVGGGVTLEHAVRIVRSVWHSERSPRPIQHADAQSRRLAKMWKE